MSVVRAKMLSTGFIQLAGFSRRAGDLRLQMVGFGARCVGNPLDVLVEGPQLLRRRRTLIFNVFWKTAWLSCKAP